MTFLKTVLILLLVYYAVKIILRFAQPYVLRYLAKKANEQFGQAFGETPFHTNNSPSNEGEITIDKTQASKKTSTNTVGEYVDFEEVD